MAGKGARGGRVWVQRTLPPAHKHPPTHHAPTHHAPARPPPTGQVTVDDVIQALGLVMAGAGPTNPAARFGPEDVLSHLAAAAGVGDPLALCVRIRGLGFYISQIRANYAEVRRSECAAWDGLLAY